MLDDTFCKTEMLAGDYIANVSMVKQLLLEGKTEECLNALEQLESAMQITLAIGELYDVKTIN